jgi:hypothetical protein
VSEPADRSNAGAVPQSRSNAVAGHASQLLREMHDNGIGIEMPACACRKSNSDIMVMQSTQDRTAKNVSGPFDGA